MLFEKAAAMKKRVWLTEWVAEAFTRYCRDYKGAHFKMSAHCGLTLKIGHQQEASLSHIKADSALAWKPDVMEFEEHDVQALLAEAAEEAEAEGAEAEGAEAELRLLAAGAERRGPSARHRRGLCTHGRGRGRERIEHAQPRVSVARHMGCLWKALV